MRGCIYIYIYVYICLKAGAAEVMFVNRSCGALTGSRVAGLFGRVPVESIVRERHGVWRDYRFVAVDGPDRKNDTHLGNERDQLRTPCAPRTKSETNLIILLKGSKQRKHMYI